MLHSTILPDVKNVETVDNFMLPHGKLALKLSGSSLTEHAYSLGVGLLRQIQGPQLLEIRMNDIFL